MDEVLRAPPNVEGEAAALAVCFTRASDAIDLAYCFLDQVAHRYGVDEPVLVLRPQRLGPQLFFRGGVLPTPDDVQHLLTRGAGLHTGDAPIEPGWGAAIRASCEWALDAEVSGVASGIVTDGVLSRSALTSALDRAVACGARYGWPVTAVLIALPDGSTSGERWSSLCQVVRTAVRAGDLVGYVGPGRLLGLLANVDPPMVGPFLDRMLAGLEGVTNGLPPEPVTAMVGIPSETADPAEVWRLLEERLAARLEWRRHGEGLEPWSGSLPSDLELGLRSLPGVVAVGTTGQRTTAGPLLSVVARAPDKNLGAAAARLVTDRFGAGVMQLVTVGDEAGEESEASAASTILENGMSPVAQWREGTAEVAQAATSRECPARERRNGIARAPRRVALLAAEFNAGTGTSEVALSRGDVHAVGRATAGPLAGGVQATLAALGMLGVEAPFYLHSAVRASALPGDPVVVVLAPSHQPALDAVVAPGHGCERIGIAAGHREVEAASRATLCALNRFLSDQPELRTA